MSSATQLLPATAEEGTQGNWNRKFTSVSCTFALRRCETRSHHYLMPPVNAFLPRPRNVLLVALGCALGLNSGFAAGQLDSLLSNSPFGSAKSGQTAEAGTQPLEFRGVLEENGQQIFSIYDTATKRSRWVGLNAASDDFVVKSYDASANSISLEQHGRVLALTLKSGPKMAQNMPLPLPPGMPQPGSNNGQPAQVLPNGAMGKGPEAQRLQQIAEEIRRRRALRQQAPQAPQMPAPTQNTAPATGNPSAAPATVPGPMLNPLPTLPGQSIPPKT